MEKMSYEQRFVDIAEGVIHVGVLVEDLGIRRKAVCLGWKEPGEIIGDEVRGVKELNC